MKERMSEDDRGGEGRDEGERLRVRANLNNVPRYFENICNSYRQVPTGKSFHRAFSLPLPSSGRHRRGSALRRGGTEDVVPHDRAARHVQHLEPQRPPTAKVGASACGAQNTHRFSVGNASWRILDMYALPWPCSVMLHAKKVATTTGPSTAWLRKTLTMNGGEVLRQRRACSHQETTWPARRTRSVGRGRRRRSCMRTACRCGQGRSRGRRRGRAWRPCRRGAGPSNVW